MNPAAKILLPLVLIAGVGGAIWFAKDPTPPPAPPGQEQPAAPAPPPVTPPLEPAAAAGAQPADPERRVVPTTGPATSPDAEQGVLGRVLQPDGNPAAGVTIYLLQGSTTSALQMYLAHRKGQRIEPVGRTTTADDGRFRLGIDQTGESFDLRVVSDHFPELQYKSIQVRKYDWFDVQDLRLEQGGIVQGRVVAEEGGYPIASAIVYLNNPSHNYQMLPTPGREQGIVAETDGSGFFRYTNAPRTGIVTIAAEADGYARTEKANQPVKPDEVTEFTLELARGQPIAGAVVDPDGRPVAGATIHATALSAKLPQSDSTASDRDGRFLLPMMRLGPYQLSISAHGYEDKIHKPVMAGDQEVVVVLEQRGRVRLRVLAANGAPLRAYTVSLKRWFPNNPGSIGKVPEFSDVRITPRDYEGDYANILNVPAGQFVFQIIESRHAKTLSPPFQMTSDGEPPVVDVTLTMGAGLIGHVVDDQGRPVPGATVTTDMNGGIAADTGFLAMFKDFMPDKHTTKSTRTDGGGRFQMSQLAFADYMLRVSHPDFCEGVSLDITLDTEGQQKDVGTIQLQRGAVVEGTCTVAGLPRGQIKVTIGPPEGFKPENDASGRPKPMFSATAITASDGSYTFHKRVPPGEYRIHAFQEAGQDDIFGRLLMMKDTQRQLFVRPGQERSVQNFEIPNR